MAFLLRGAQDTFFNAYRLRNVLITEVVAGRNTDYFGRTMRFFSYGAHNLTHLQGGGYVLSRRAASALAACKLGPWVNCPPASRGGVFRDVHDRKGDAYIQSRCDAPQVNAEDLLTGVCMHEAGFAPAHNWCMKALGAATDHTPTAASRAGSAAPSRSVARDALPSTAVRQGNARLLHKLRHDPRCPCPITAHPLKGAELLGHARRAMEQIGCGTGDWHSSVSRAAEKQLQDRKARKSRGPGVGGGSGSARMADTLLGMEKMLPCEKVLNESYPIAPGLRALLKLDCPPQRRGKGSPPVGAHSKPPKSDGHALGPFGRLLRLFSSPASPGDKEPEPPRPGDAVVRSLREATTREQLHERRAERRAERRVERRIERQADATLAGSRDAGNPVVIGTRTQGRAATGTSGADTAAGDGALLPAWAVSPHTNCYDGMGGKHIGDARIKDLVLDPVSDAPQDGASSREGATRRFKRGLNECIRRCVAQTEVPCHAVTVLARPQRKKEKKHSNCYFRSRVTPALCARDSRFDTYAAPKSRQS